MQAHGIALWRWLRWHRREMWVGGALVVVVGVLVFAGPLLLGVAAIEWKRSRRRRARLLGLALAGVLVRAVVWLWQELWDVPHGRWHPCVQCGKPIEEPSRASYCSPICRRYAKLERDARAFDPWIARRALERLERLSKPAPVRDPALDEIPF